MFMRNKKMKMYNKNKYNGYNNNSNIKNVVKDSNYKLLSEGMSGDDVEKVQKMLVEIVNLYPSLPIITIDGVYGISTVNAVKEFQKLNSLPQTGNVDDITLNKLRVIHNTNRDRFTNEILKEKFIRNDEQDNMENGVDFLDQSENILHEGSKGEYVKTLQSYLNVVSNKYPTINLLKIDGIFGPKTKAAVKEFQRIFSLKQDGIVGQNTWNMLSTQTGGNPISVDDNSVD